MATGPEFTNLADLASARVGGRAIATNDDFFAPKSNLVKPEPAVFIPGQVHVEGQVDGRLGIAPPPRPRPRLVHRRSSACAASCTASTSIPATSPATFRRIARSKRSTRRAAPKPAVHAVEGAPWTTLLEKTALRGNGDNFFAIADRRPWTHLRLSIYPDGGVARLRVYGEVAVDWARVAPAGRVVDLASITNGGLFLDASDTHYGTKGALIMPDRAKNMGDGWETRRRRGPGHDWAIVRLGATGIVSKVEIDTNHYKGNYPDRASLEGCLAPGASVERLHAAAWSTILPETKLSANKRHYLFRQAVAADGAVSHVRLNIFPDGGVSRLRIHGTLART